MSTAILEPLSTYPKVGLDLYIDEDRYETSNGQFIEMPPASNIEMLIMGNIRYAISPLNHEQQRGRILHRTIIRLSPDAPRTWRPDLLYISFDRWPEGRPLPISDPWDMVPELTIEVLSPTNTNYDTVDRIDAYFAAGMKAVWVVYPHHFKIYVYDSPTSVRILQSPDELDGGTILPGLRLPVASLFEDVPPMNP